MANSVSPDQWTMAMHTRQRGISLIELMIAMVLGLIVSAAVMQIYLANSQASRLNDAMSRMQENGRFALNLLQQDLRQAGFRGGCQGRVKNLLNEDHAGYQPELFDLNRAIEGWRGEQGPAPDDYLDDTDVIVVKHAANISGLTASGNTPAHAANIQLTSASGVLQGSIVVVGDIQACDMFQNTSQKTANNLNRGPGGWVPGNKAPANTNLFSKSYDGELQIFTMTSHLYYVGESDDATTDDVYALRRVQYNLGVLNDQPNHEIIDGVRDMRILYLQGTDYVEASAVSDWSGVSAVQVSLLLQSINDNVATEPMSLPFAGTTFNATDRRLYQVFATTVGLRNRLP